MKKAFTLIELLVVVAMIAVLMGAMTTSVNKARRRARIAKATQEAKELTNAILAYEQYDPNHSLESVASGGWTECTEGALAMVLGGKEGASGEKIPVLYNASLSGGKMLDPWRHPYEFLIEKTGSQDGGGGEEAKGTQFIAAPHLPNFWRLADAERGLQ